MLARQTGADIISTEPGLARIRATPVQGHMSVRAALDRLLEGTGYRAIAVDTRSFRIVRNVQHHHIASRSSAPSTSTTGAEPEIIVTASKQHVTLLRYPGSIVSVAGAGGPPGSTAANDLSELARGTPVLQHTELGTGRNKIFIRGIADSSFNGPTQSTASMYFGDVQLGYSGPEPGLKMYDMQNVEVLEGPQGTLYGSGAIGGVIRLTPNAPNLLAYGGSVAGGVTTTIGAEPGFDASGVINIPLVTDRAGMRVVAYRERDGGYIDDARRNVKNINRTDTAGARAAITIDPGDGWSVETSGLFQQIDARDTQYAQSWAGPLTRQSVAPQPFRNHFWLLRGIVSKKWDSGLQLFSATGLMDYHAAGTYDATIPPPSSSPVPGLPMLYSANSSKLLISHEMRLSRSLPSGNSWVVGITLLRDRDASARQVGPAGNPTDIISVTNVNKSASLFGEATIALSRAFSATLGGRLTIARADGEPSIQPRSQDFIQGRSTRRLDPTAAFSWLLAPRFAAYGRVQTGYRTGGLAVARGIGRVADFKSDSILVGELGLRMLRRGPTGLVLSTSVSYARWNNIQADLYNRRGQPYTDNIGDARIETFEAMADWIPLKGLRATAAFLYTHNRVSGALADSSSEDHRRLPDTPPFAGNLRLSYEWNAGQDSVLRLGASTDHVGRSVLGIGDYLDIPQGPYTVLGLNAGWKWRRFDTSITLDNITNEQANRFAFGNPFTFGARDQVTPLRPFNARLGVAYSW